MINVADRNAIYYYHYDGLRSVVALSDENAMIIERYTYDVFGGPNVWDDKGDEDGMPIFCISWAIVL